MVILDGKFPLEDVDNIGARLTASGALVPGYEPAEVGLLNPAAIFYARKVDGMDFMLLPDRNLVSRMAAIAREGLRRPGKLPDPPDSIAVDLMAFAQAMDFDIEPSIAFHELAHRNGNDAAMDELSWFRAADHGQAQAWIDLAQGRTDRLPIAKPAARVNHDLARPLDRWTRNYVVTLKIAELELAPLSPLERILSLYRWLVDELFLAGPAASFATMYFSPNARRHRLIKQLRSPERGRAIAGVRNAAWDITYLSDFVLRVARGVEEGRFYILATADRNLAQIAAAMVLDADYRDSRAEYARRLVNWWPEREAAVIADALLSHVKKVEGRPPPAPRSPSADPLGELVEAGERRLLDWRPK